MSAGQRSRRMRTRAFAKINLSLRVLGIRDDGYHELRTVFQSLALHDTLTFVAAGDFAIACDAAGCPCDNTNLVWRAAEAVWRAARRPGTPHGVRVRITKRIPMQAGLGGGSSDAAAALRGFARLWKLRKDALPELATDLGADVPFFLVGGTALGVERGDLLFPLTDVPALWVVIVLPDFGVSTKNAYAWFDAGAAAISKKKPSRLPLPEFGNDLEAPVGHRHPEIPRLVKALARSGAVYAAMSGSGSAVFGLFDRRQTAERCVNALNARTRTSRAMLTRTLGRPRFASLSEPI